MMYGVQMQQFTSLVNWTDEAAWEVAWLTMSAIALVPSAAAPPAKAVVVRYKITWKGIGLT